MSRCCDVEDLSYCKRYYSFTGVVSGGKIIQPAIPDVVVAKLRRMKEAPHSSLDFVGADTKVYVQYVVKQARNFWVLWSLQCYVKKRSSRINQS